MTELECIQCGTPYTVDVWARRHTHFCETCREGRARAQDRERKAELQQALQDLRARALLAEEDAVSLGPDVVPDRQPVGWIAPYGSEEGRSSYFRDLRIDLDRLSVIAAGHPWWSENPHWCAPLHVEMPTTSTVLECGDQRGTRAGYLRHRKANEMACAECSAANAEYMANYRANPAV